MGFSLKSGLTAALCLLSTSTTASILRRDVSNIKARGSDWPVNCKGSSMCKWSYYMIDSAIKDLAPLPDSLIWYPQQEIWCSSGALHITAYCLFAQGMTDSFNVYFSPSHNDSAAGIDAGTVKQLLRELKAHGCRGCGSVSISEAAKNNTITFASPSAAGYLTMNYQVGGCGSGVCLPSLLDTDNNNPITEANATMIVKPKLEALAMKPVYVNGEGTSLPVFFTGGRQTAGPPPSAVRTYAYTPVSSMLVSSAAPTDNQGVPVTADSVPAAAAATSTPNPAAAAAATSIPNAAAASITSNQAAYPEPSTGPAAAVNAIS